MRCIVEGCQSTAKARKWCGKHYARWYRLGDPLASIYVEYGCSDEERLRSHGWTKVEGPLDTPCWVWGGNILGTGYGQVSVNGEMRSPHRFAYETWVGPIPEEMHVLHSCDNPPCINPLHLRVGTHADNMQDRKIRGRAPDHRGERHPGAKLTWEKVEEIRASQKSNKELASKYGVDPAAIHAVRTGRSWKTTNVRRTQ